MRKITSTQVDVAFVFCASPVTIDKRASWGDKADNLQHGPDGAYLKLSSPTEVSHLVQPNDDKSAPIGWVQGSAPGLFSKAPIWVTDEIIPPGETVVLETADGKIEYKVKEPSMICYNDLDGHHNPADAWVQKMKDLKKNYVFKDDQPKGDIKPGLLRRIFG